MKPWFYNEQSITEFKEPVVYKGLNISVSKTKVKPPYIATVTSPATGKEVVKMGGNTEQEALDSAKQAVDKREADAPKISAGGQTSVLLNTPSNDELLKDPSMYNMIYAKISKDRNGPTLVIGNEVYGRADLEADGFVGSYDRRTKRGKDSEETLPQVMFNANNKLLSQIGIKMNGRYTLDTSGKYRDDNEHTVYPLQFQGSTVHAGDRLRMSRPALTIGATREDAQPWFQRELEEAEIIKFPEPKAKVIELPNVQSYPDFLTGVKDLYNRKEQGEISQDSHDRLYQDLIHRFMKKESFETPWFLREATQKLINGSSRGVYNEIILAIAIFFKFRKGGQEINEEEVKNGLKKLSQTQQGFQAKTSAGDIVKLIIGDKGPKLTADLQDTNNIQLMNAEITGNTGFANVDIDTEKFSKIFAENKKPDNIIVKQMGGERSKIDVLLSYDKDGNTVNIKGYSAKTYSPRLDNTDVNTLEAVSKYFAPFGVKIDVTKYQEIDKKVSSTELFKNVFQKVVDFGDALLKKDNESGERIFVNSLMTFVKTAMTGGEDDFLLVDISKGDFSTHDFAVLMNNLDKVNLSIRLRTFAKSGQPMIEIFDSKSDLNLLILRYTYSEPRISKSSGKLPGRNRIFVDAGPLFKQLSKVVYNEK